MSCASGGIYASFFGVRVWLLNEGSLLIPTAKLQGTTQPRGSFLPWSGWSAEE